MNIRILIFSIFVLCFSTAKAQEVLTSKKAVSLALEHNYGLMGNKLL